MNLLQHDECLADTIGCASNIYYQIYIYIYIYFLSNY